MYLLKRSEARDRTTAAALQFALLPAACTFCLQAASVVCPRCRVRQVAPALLARGKSAKSSVAALLPPGRYGAGPVFGDLACR